MIALGYGTRPQIIKASILRKALAPLGEVWAIDTGQHYDFALNELLYQQLGVAPADRYLEVGSAGHAEQTAGILTRAEAVLKELAPRVVVVIGDTNSTLGMTLAAVKLRIPVVHVEAGLRARDRMMAEEINRRAVDAVATLLCTPCESATRRMQAEHPDAIVVETGDVAYDVLKGAVARLDGSALSDLDVGGLDLEAGFIYSTLHRAELTDDPARLDAALEALGKAPLPVLLALHPRTRAVLERRGLSAPRGRVTTIPAVGYLQSLTLARAASAIVTDSGGLQREAYWLGTPCLTLRGETEWTETLDAGANHLLDPLEAPAKLPALLAAQLSRRGAWAPTAYGTGQAAAAVARAIAPLL